MAEKLKKKPDQLERENDELRARLEAAEETLHAIQNLKVDAIVAHTDKGDQVFTLAGAERPYRVFVETMNQGAAILSPSGMLMYANDCLTRMLELPLERLIGSSMREFIEQEEEKDFESLFRRGKDRSSKGEFRLLAANGERIPAYLSISAVDIEGIPGACFLASDLSEQKLLEQSRLEVDKQKLERELRNQFIAALSHDLQNPLSAARLAIELLLKSSDYSGMSHRLKQVIRDIDRVDRMIRDFLDAGRIKAGASLPLTVTEFDLNEAVASVVSDLKRVHGDRFVLRAGEPMQGFLDREQISRAIENLANNAIKYGGPMTPVTIALERREEWVRIVVHNEGRPIPQSRQAGIFTDFSEMKLSKTTGQKGWGIGLVLVRGVAEGHGGTVRVESGFGSGTTFTIEIPRDARAFQTRAA